MSALLTPGRNAGCPCHTTALSSTYHSDSASGCGRNAPESRPSHCSMSGPLMADCCQWVLQHSNESGHIRVAAFGSVGYTSVFSAMSSASSISMPR